MSNITELLWSKSGAVALAIGAVLLYVASRAAVDALAARADLPGRRAFGHWMPIAAAAILATLLKRPDLALVTVFCTSIAVMSLVVGSVLIAAPAIEAIPEARRLWALMLPVAFMTFVIGLSGHLTWVHAIVLLIAGVVFLPLWSLPPVAQAEISSTENPTVEKPPILQRFLLRPVNFILALAMCAIGGFFAIRGTVLMAASRPQLPCADIMITVGVSVLLAVAMLFESFVLAEQKRGWVAVTSGAGVVLLNLCLLLPLVILLGGIDIDLTHPLTPQFGGFLAVVPVVFPAVLWRVDNMMLLVVCLIVLPASVGRWQLGKAEGFTLIATFLAYILLEIFANF